MWFLRPRKLAAVSKSGRDGAAVTRRDRQLPYAPLQSQSRPQVQLWQLEPKMTVKGRPVPWCKHYWAQNLACVRLTRHLPQHSLSNIQRSPPKLDLFRGVGMGAVNI